MIGYVSNELNTYLGDRLLKMQLLLQSKLKNAL